VNGYFRFVLPADPDDTDYAIYGVVVLLAAVAAVTLLTYLWALLRAPYEQRNALRVRTPVVAPVGPDRLTALKEHDASSLEKRGTRLIEPEVGSFWARRDGTVL
jgi:hypothetical protein